MNKRKSIRPIMLFSVAILFLVMFSGCNKKHEPINALPKIVDSTGILSNAVIRQIRDTSFSTGYFILVETRQKVEEENLTMAGNRAFDNAASRNDTLAGRGIYIFVTRNPAMIQLRVGKNIQYQSMQKNLAQGKKYMAIQEKARAGNLDMATLDMIQHVKEKLPGLDDISWYKKGYNNVVPRFAHEKLVKWGQPEHSIFGGLVKPILWIRIFEMEHLNTGWFTFVIMVLLFYLANLIINGGIGLFSGFFIDPDNYPKGMVYLNVVIGIFLKLFFIFLGASVVYLLSSARLEDKISLAAQGINRVWDVSPRAGLFYSMPGIWLILILLFLNFYRQVLANLDVYAYSATSRKNQRALFIGLEEDNPSRARQLRHLYFHSSISDEKIDTQEEFGKAPFSAVANKLLIRNFDQYFFLFVLILPFLPVTISLGVSYFLLIGVLSMSLKGINDYVYLRKELPLDSMTLSGYFLGPLAILVILLLLKEGIAPFIHVSWLVFSPGIAIGLVARSIFSLSTGILWIVVVASFLLIFLLLMRRFGFRYNPRKAIMKFLLACLILFSIGAAFSVFSKGANGIKQTMAKLYPLHYEFEVAEYPRYTVTARSLNFRKKAGKESPVVGSLGYGDTVQVIGSSKKGWLKIEFKGQKGHVYSKYLEQIDE